MNYKFKIKCSDDGIIDADNIEEARAKVEEMAEEIGAMDIGVDSIKVKRIKQNSKEAKEEQIGKVLHG
jgi:hypothetical protein